MREFKKIAVLGGGAFGAALAQALSPKSEKVFLWLRNKHVMECINRDHQHPTKLNSVLLSQNIIAELDIKQALLGAQIVVIALPINALSDVVAHASPFIDKDAIVVCTTKGIEEKSLRLPCDIISDNLPRSLSQRACFLSGPSFAKELVQGLPTALSLANKDVGLARSISQSLSSKNLQLYPQEDTIGVCVGGALKNVIAIAAGACTALGLGKNALASLITQGVFETNTLAKARGAHHQTLEGLSGVGDLVLSCTDSESRNFRLGTLLVSGLELKNALTAIGSAVEGVDTAKAIPSLCQKYTISLPICSMVFQALYEDVALKKGMDSLFFQGFKGLF